MTEQNIRWNEYYRESQPAARKRVLERLLGEGPDDGADAFRKLLYKSRYTDEKDPGNEVDLFLYECVNLIQIFHMGRIFRKRAQKELAMTGQRFCLEAAEQYGPAGEEVLYRELRNTVKRYFRTCTSSGYRRGTFGLVGSSAEEKKRQMVKDAWEMSTGVTRKYGREDAFRVWNRAVREELFSGDPEAEQLFRDYEAKQADH